MVSKSTVSRMCESLSEDYKRFKERDLSGYDVAYLFVDAVYEPLRRHGTRSGVMCCWGICSNGSRVLLDLTLANSESKVSAMEFFQGMIRRGLQPPLTVTTDGAMGLIAAVEATWPRSLRVRCWFHKMQNLHQKVPPNMWSEFRHRVIDFRDAPNEAEARSAAGIDGGRLRWRFAGSLSLLDGRPGSFAEPFECSAAASTKCSHGELGGAQLRGGAPKNQGDSAPLG